MQYEAFARQEAVRQNVCATFLSVSDEKLVQYAPQPEHIVIEVKPRQQDSSFATDLALLIRDQSAGLAGKQLSILCTKKQTCMGAESHIQGTLISS